jgi:transcriptional regulator with XRE-family HTH domain
LAAEWTQTDTQEDALVLSDTVGEQIKLWRKRRGWTRERLGEECGRLGLPLTEAIITNIESGRLTSAKRRRMVTIDEFVVIAFALNVPPAVLISPYPETEQSELFPGELIASWVPYLWLAGKRFPYHSKVSPDFDEFAVAAENFLEAAEPLELVVEHDARIRRRCEASGRYKRSLNANDTEDQRKVGEVVLLSHLQKVEKCDIDLMEIRDEFRDRGFPLPSLPGALRYLKNQRASEYQPVVVFDDNAFSVASTARHNAYAEFVLTQEEEE